MTSPRDPTQFTRESAERIANVVRAAELTPRAGRPLVFDKADDPPSRKVFRLATFTGDWPKYTDKVVTFHPVPNTPNTALVTNLFYPVEPGPPYTSFCAIAKDGTAWYLINVPMRTATATLITTRQIEVLTGVSFDLEACSIYETKEEIQVIDTTSTASFLQLDF